MLVKQKEPGNLRTMFCCSFCTLSLLKTLRVTVIISTHSVFYVFSEAFGWQESYSQSSCYEDQLIVGFWSFWRDLLTRRKTLPFNTNHMQSWRQVYVQNQSQLCKSHDAQVCGDSCFRSHTILLIFQSTRPWLSSVSVNVIMLLLWQYCALCLFRCNIRIPAA